MKNPADKRWIAQALFFTLMAALAYSLFRPTPPPEVFSQSDKVGHLLAFAVVCLSGRLALQRMPGNYYWGSWLLLAFLLEYLQGALRPLRVFSLEDALANAIGIMMGLIIWILLKRYRSSD